MMEGVENSVMLTKKRNGHTSWGLHGTLAKAMNRYLIAGELSMMGTEQSRDE